MKPIRALLLGMTVASCGVPGMIEGPVPLIVREGTGEYRQVASCAYMAIEREGPDVLIRTSGYLTPPLQKTDLQSVVYIDRGANHSWRLIISPAGVGRTRIELNALRPTVGLGIYENVVKAVSGCLR